MYYVNIFFIYSFLGFLFENIVSLIKNSHFNSGILYVPWTFIYGIAVLVLMILSKFLKQFKINKYLKVLIFFISSAILMTLIEFSGGMLIEKLFHIVYWDYTSLKDNYGHYIALKTSLGWGVFATIANYILIPRVNKLAQKIPWYVTLIIVILFIVDVIVTFMN